MKKLFNVLTLWTLLLGASCAAQSTTVSATITDTDGFVWKNGSWTAQFVPNGSQPNISQYTWNGAPLAGHTQFGGALDSSGTFSGSIPTTSYILPTGSSWKFQVCPNAVNGCFQLTTPTVGTTLDLTSQLSALAKGPRFTNNDITYGYGTVEVTLAAFPGVIFYNTTTGTCQQYTGSDWSSTCNGGGGGGGLTVLPNIAALKTYAGVSQQILVVSYNTSTIASFPDGGGGMFLDQGAGASQDDGGLIIYNTVTGHNWARQVGGSTLQASWFGVNNANTDNTTPTQNAINSLCNNSVRPLYGALEMPAGILKYLSGLTVPCNFNWFGQGIVGAFGNAHNGTMLRYDGGDLDDFVLINSNNPGNPFYWLHMQIRQMEFSWNGSDNTYKTNAIGYPAVPPSGANMMLESSMEWLQFSNWTGAAEYYHVAAPSSTVTTRTAYISDGTGAAPGNVVCVQGGALPYNTGLWLTGAGIASSTFTVYDLSGIDVFSVTCTGPGGGTAYAINGAALNISSESVAFGFAQVTYHQEDTKDHIFLSGVRQWIGQDILPPGSTGLNNVFHADHIYLENGQSFSAGGLPNAWADLNDFCCLTINDIVYEGGAPASSYVFKTTNGTFSNLYIENGTPGAFVHSVFDVSQRGYIKLSDSVLEAAYNDYGWATFEPYTYDSVILIDNANIIPTIAYARNLGNAFDNHLQIKNTGYPNSIYSDMISWDAWEKGFVRCDFSISGRQCTLDNKKEVTYIDSHGDWLDGLDSGLVSLSTFNVANQGLKTDSKEGRLFEIVGIAGAQPGISIALNNIPDNLRGQQIIVTEKWKFHTTTVSYVMCGIGQSGQMPIQTGTGGVFSNCTAAIYQPDTWYTSYFVGVIPAAGTANISSIPAIGSPALAGGTVTFDVSALHVSVGSQVTPTTMGGNALEAKSWYCSAAPTFGDFIVKDSCTNSTPASGQPIGWVNTVAGSPGTWRPLPSLP